MQYMPTGERRYVLQDANYNVVGIFRECGESFDGSNGDNGIIRQFSYDPYGELNSIKDGRGTTVCEHPGRNRRNPPQGHSLSTP